MTIQSNSVPEITLRNGEVIDVSSVEYHKYFTPQTPYKGKVFVMESTFKAGFDGYLVNCNTHEGNKWYLFFRETVERWGEWALIEGKFLDENKVAQPFYRIALEQADGTGLS